MSYTGASGLGVLLAVAADLWLWRTMLVRRRVFWVSYAIVLAFQLVVNGILTGLGIVRYSPHEILGWRVAWAPVEDLGFGFALALCTLSTWVWLGRRDAVVGPAARAPR